MIKIDNRVIDNNSPVFVIAEAGVNHNADINIAKKLIDAAVDAGADAVKFQTYKTENLVTNYANMADYQKNNTGKVDSQYNMLKKLELSFEDFKELKRYCDSKDIIFMSTPFDFESANFLNQIGMEIFKISSADLTNIPLLQHIAKFQKPIILSSGMADLTDIEDALEAINYDNNENIAVLHCTSNYPADINSVNMRAIDTITNTFKVTSGYSDHTEGLTIPIAAAARGVAIIEKHFTLDRNMNGPDHKASIEPNELIEMVHSIRNIEKALGNGIKKITDSELNTSKVARKSIVAARNIKAGETIKFKDLDYKRPGTGLMPKFYKDIIGKKAAQDIEKDEQIQMSSICD